jgi:YVTN family beta-propeller protein
VVRSVDLGFSEGVAVTPDGKFVYVVSFYDGVVSILNADLSGAGSVSVGNNPIAVAITPDGKHAYVANQGDSTISVIDTATELVTATITVGGGPNGIAITPDGKRAYVSTLGNTVSVIATVTNTVVGNVPLAGPSKWGRRHARWKTRLRSS